MELRSAHDGFGVDRIRCRWAAPVMVPDGRLKKPEMDNAL